MKKLFMFGFSALLMFAFTACKSSESAYKKAYEQAKQQEVVVEEVEYVAPAPVVRVTPAPKPQPKPVHDSSVREEKVTVVSPGANNLRNYSVIAGSFGVKSNANNLKRVLDGEGYDAMVVYNAENNMYRVVVSTFDDKDSAQRARDSFKRRYPNRKDFQGAWLLYRLY